MFNFECVDHQACSLSQYINVISYLFSMLKLIAEWISVFVLPLSKYHLGL